eukprot:SAG22_NODE_878_length_6715_cov_9.368652_9_plen_203_part_00
MSVRRHNRCIECMRPFDRFEPRTLTYYFFTCCQTPSLTSPAAKPDTPARLPTRTSNQQPTMQAPPTLAFDVVAGLSFKALKKSPVTAEVSTKSAKCGNVSKGAEVTALESCEMPSGALRIKIDRGWVTARKPDGSKNMEVAVDENTRKMVRPRPRNAHVFQLQASAFFAVLRARATDQRVGLPPPPPPPPPHPASSPRRTSR